MEDVGIEKVMTVAEGISNYGLLVIMGAFYIVITAMMMIAMFKWFKAIISQILQDNREGMKAVLSETQKQNEMLCDISEGLRTETQLRIRNLTGFAFDLSVEQVCRIIKKVREENHIVDRAATGEKVRKLLHNIHEDRNSRFDPFTYRGRCISTYSNPEWIEKVAQIVEGELYNPNGADNKRAYTNVKMVYDDIKIDFYHRLND